MHRRQFVTLAVLTMLGGNPMTDYEPPPVPDDELTDGDTTPDEEIVAVECTDGEDPSE